MLVNEEVKKELIEMQNNGHSLKEICKRYYELTNNNIKTDSIRKQLNRWQPKQKVIGVIGDIHLPFEHSEYLKFCKETFKKWGVTEIIQIGDLIDNHAISRHQTEVDAMGGYSEYTMAKEKLQAWIQAFPKMKICIGNHDAIPERQAKTLGLHYGFIKTFSEMWNLPKTWEVKDEFIIDNIIYNHGLGTGGIHGTLNYASIRRMSVVCGHKHSLGGVRYLNNGIDTIFAMDVGCGIEHNKYAFKYGKTMPKKPMLGVGIVISNEEAYFIPMKKTS